MPPPETGFVRASRSRSSDGGCHRPPALSLDDLGEDAGPSGILPASPIPADYALPLADDHAEALLANVLVGQPSLAAACSRLFDKRSSYAAIAFLHHCIYHWPQADNATGGPLLQQLTGSGNPAHLLSCVLLYISSTERRTAAEAAKAWHALCQRVAADKLLEAVLAEPNCLQWMLEAVDLPNSPMRLSICGTAIPLKHRESAADNVLGRQTSNLSSSSIISMMSMAPEVLLNTLIHQLLAILRRQDSPRGTAAAAMLLNAAVDCNTATVLFLQPHLSSLLDVQHCLQGRDQDYILQVLSAVAATEEGVQYLANCDLAYLIETMQQNLSQDCTAAGLAADIIASMLAQCEAGRAALLPHVAVLAKVCEQKVDTRSAGVAACAVHTMKWIADCNGPEGHEAVCRHAGSMLLALARMTLPRKAAFWEVGAAVQAADGTCQRTIVDLAVDDAAALLREACRDRAGAAYIASKPTLMCFLQHALTNLSCIEAEQPLLDLSFVLLALAAVPAGWLALVSSDSLDALLKVAYTSNSTAAQHALAAMSRVLHMAALGTAEAAPQRQAAPPPANARKQLQIAVAAELANALTHEHTTQLLCLLSQPQLSYLGYCCVHQLLRMDCGRIILQPYVEALLERVYAQLPVFAVTKPWVSVAKAAQATAVYFDTFEFIKNLQLLAECSQIVRTDCYKQLQDANDLMQQAIIGFAEAYVAAHHAGGGTAARVRQDKPLMVLLVVVHKAVAERDSTAELADSMQPQALPGPSAQRLTELSLHDWLHD